MRKERMETFRLRVSIDGDFLLTCFLFCILYLNKIKR
jgi:hypothetical protein